MLKQKFDKMRCIANIYGLAKQKNMKIGELESKAGVSAGYLSRLNKEDSTASPSIEFLAVMATELDISLDTLIGAELAKLTSTEEYILNFLKRLIIDTESDKLVWLRETKQELDELDADADFHPLFMSKTQYYQEDEFSRAYEVLKYISAVKGSDSAVVNGDCFRVQVYGNAEVYITNVRFENQNSNETDCEIFLVKDRIVNAVCSTKNVKSEISIEIFSLYQSVSNSMYRLHLKKDVKDIIDGYVENKPVPAIDDEEIPF